MKTVSTRHNQRLTYATWCFFGSIVLTAVIAGMLFFRLYVPVISEGISTGFDATVLSRDLMENAGDVWALLGSPLVFILIVAVCTVAIRRATSGGQLQHAVLLIPLISAISLAVINFLIASGPGLIVLSIPLLIYPAAIALMHD